MTAMLVAWAELKKVPSVLYGFDATGKEERVLLWLDEVPLAREYRTRGAAFHNTLYNLYVDGVKTSTMVLPRDLVMHPSTCPQSSLSWTLMGWHVGWVSSVVDVVVDAWAWPRCARLSLP